MTEEETVNSPVDTRDKPDSQNPEMLAGVSHDTPMERQAADAASPVKTREYSGAPESIKMPNVVQKAQFPQLGGSEKLEEIQNIGLLLDVPLPVSIELGRTTMNIEDILNLGPGSVVELNRLVGEPVDLLVNSKMIARGEVVVVDENFGIRITDLIAPQERLK